MSDFKTGEHIDVSLRDLVEAKEGDELYIKFAGHTKPVRCKIGKVLSDTMGEVIVLPKDTIKPPAMGLD